MHPNLNWTLCHIYAISTQLVYQDRCTLVILGTRPNQNYPNLIQLDYIET